MNEMLTHDLESVLGMPVIASELVPLGQTIISSDLAFPSSRVILMHPLDVIVLKHGRDYTTAYAERWKWIEKHRIEPLVRAAYARIENMYPEESS